MTALDFSRRMLAEASKKTKDADPIPVSLKVEMLADLGDLYTESGQTLQGSFSAVSKQNFASKYAFESSRRDLHNALLCTALNHIKKCLNFAKTKRQFSDIEFCKNRRYSSKKANIGKF